MIILVDIDNTITNFSEMLLKQIQKCFIPARQYSYKDIDCYEWFNNLLPNPWVWTESEYFWNIVQVHPKAITTLEQWVKQGHKVLLVTASHFNNTLGYKIRKTLEPFNSKLINERNIIIAQDKSAIRGDLMIDDCVDNLIDFNGVRICYAQPWNEKYIDIFRYNDWNKINSIVEVYNYILLSK